MIHSSIQCGASTNLPYGRKKLKYVGVVDLLGSGVNGEGLHISCDGGLDPLEVAMMW